MTEIELPDEVSRHPLVETCIGVAAVLYGEATNPRSRWDEQAVTKLFEDFADVLKVVVDHLTQEAP